MKYSNTKPRRRGRRKIELTDGMHRGFNRGILAVSLGNQDELRHRLTLLIGGTPSKFNYWKNGQTVINQEDATKIEIIFADYGVKPEHIWDK